MIFPPQAGLPTQQLFLICLANDQDNDLSVSPVTHFTWISGILDKRHERWLKGCKCSNILGFIISPRETR